MTIKHNQQKVDLISNNKIHNHNKFFKKNTFQKEINRC